MPTPKDMAEAPVWENYVVAQAVQASLGSIPPNALAVGVAVSEQEVEFVFQLATATQADEDDMAEIVDGFNMLIGFVVPVSSSAEVVAERDIRALTRPIRWIFLNHLGSARD